MANVSSKTRVKEAPPAIRKLPQAETAIGAFCGVTERGPIGEATRVTDWDSYEKTFGGFTADADVALAALGFFDNGGEQLYVTRICHYTDISDADTFEAVKGTDNLVTPGAATPATVTGSVVPPVRMEPDDRLIISIDGGGDQTATFAAVAAALECANSDTYALTDGWTLLVEIDAGLEQTITFNTADFANIALATAEEVAAVINEDIVGASATVTSAGTKVTITSDRKGTGSHVQVTGGTANGALGFSTTIVDGTGDVSDITSVTLSEIETVVEADVTNIIVQSGTGGVVELVHDTPGASYSIQVQATSELDTVLGFDNDVHTGSDSGSVDCTTVSGKTEGAYANNVTATVQDASSGDATEFDLLIVVDGLTEEAWRNLTPDPTGDRYYETIVNDDRTGSNLVALTDLDVAGNPRPSNQSITLSGGDDGLTGLADTDFLGNESAGTGLYAFDTIDEQMIYACPGRSTAAVHTGEMDYIATKRSGRGWAVLGVDEDQTAEEVQTYADTNTYQYTNGEFGGLYGPRIKIVNPDEGAFGTDEQIVVPCEGHIAGMIARTDSASDGGIYQPPAGKQRGILVGVVGLDGDWSLKEAKRDIVASRLVNPINRNTATEFYVDGVWTCRDNYNFPTVAERRGVSFIETTIAGGIDIYRFDNNSAKLRAQVDRDIEHFLLEQLRLGAFRSTIPAEAFNIVVSDDVNLVYANKLEVTVSLATQKPAIWIDLIFSQDLRAILEGQSS